MTSWGTVEPLIDEQALLARPDDGAVPRQRHVGDFHLGLSGGPYRQNSRAVASPYRPATRAWGCHILVETLRKPLFVVALVLLTIAVLVEIGSTAIVKDAAVNARGVLNDARSDPKLGGELEDVDEDDLDEMEGELETLQDEEDPPGLAISYLALVDGLLLFIVLLMGLALLLPDRVHGKLQGVLTLIVSLLVLIGGVILASVAFLLLLLMVGLFSAVPFGTITYLVLFGFFARPSAAAVLALVFLLKIGFVVFLVLAQERFLQSKGLVLLTATSLLASLIVSFLHGLVPLPLVSITDALAAVIVAILAIVWALLMLIGSIISIIKLLRFDRTEG